MIVWKLFPWYNLSMQGRQLNDQGQDYIVMKSKTIKIRMKTLSLVFILTLMVFSINYLNAKKAIEKYTQILTIHNEESYQRVKKNIYKISSEEVRNTVFKSDSYNGNGVMPIEYFINEIKCEEIKGFNHFIFYERFTVIGWKTVESLVYIKDGVVYDTHRKD